MGSIFAFILCIIIFLISAVVGVYIVAFLLGALGLFIAFAIAFIPISLGIAVIVGLVKLLD